MESHLKWTRYLDEDTTTCLREGNAGACVLTGPDAGRLTLPEGEKDDRLDHEELEHGVVGDKQLTRGEVEEEERVERQTDRYVVDDGHVQVAASHAEGGTHRIT